MRRPAVDGWFSVGSDDGAARPALLGWRCKACGSWFFPKRYPFCRNPACGSTDVVEVELSRRGTLWSYTDNRFAPPPPFVSGEPFEPYVIAAVALDREQMTVLGRLPSDVDVSVLRVGMEMELDVHTLYTDSDTDGDVVMWAWRPASEATS